MDLNLDDLDGPSKAPAAKASKFAPKNSKFKPVAKPKSEPGETVPPAVVPKVELDDSKPPPPVDFVTPKTKDEQPSNPVTASSDANDTVKMDLDVKEMEVDGQLQQEQCGEDQVVREIDVFFTPTFDANSKLYVLQYALRPHWRPYELDDRCEKVRVKPGSAEVEVEMSPSVDPENFDLHAEDKAMQKQILSSKWKTPLKTGYAVGILMGNKVYLNPVHAVVQLRPSMQHLTGQSSRKMNMTRDDEDMIDSEDIKKEKIIKPSKKQNKLAGPLTAQNEDTSEQWISLKYHGAMSEFSSQYRQRMVGQEASQIQFSMSPSDYINSLCASTASDKFRPKGPSRRELLKLPLGERYKTWLLKGPSAHRFNALKHLAPDYSDEDVLGVLRTHALLVQGLWVAKSKLKYGKDGGLDVLLRDYILLQFSKNLFIHEAELPRGPKAIAELKTILKEFAVWEGSRGWKFKETPDDTFIKQYPHVVEEQRQQWDRTGPKITEGVHRNNPKQNARPTSNNTIEVAPRTTNPPPPRTMLSDETREALPKALQKLFQTYKVCSFSQIRQRLRDMAISGNSGNTLRRGNREARAVAAAADAPQEELLNIINQVAVNIHGAFVPKSSPEHPQYDEFRTVVINLLLAEPNAKLKKAAIYEAAKMQLKREITPVEYQKVLNELCVSQHSAWVLKSGDGNPT